ncbi:transmembrane protein 51 isoform X1 [Gorilla gorilla gorilla]|uniref:transmembrane protein 51 isoform X1 n=1 Tax=Gorilla gorilla gorilla TaxID=9595 RepID=UPI0024458E79|nr:transmembrane protein 51 isoform X1 [Gorilla gorilla gorilla]
MHTDSLGPRQEGGSGLYFLPTPSYPTRLARVGENLGPAPGTHSAHSSGLRWGVGARPAQLRSLASGPGVVPRAGREGRPVGGASPDWRPLLAGAALRLPRSLPPARRRSQAALPASPTRSLRGQCALSTTAFPRLRIPRTPAPRSRRPPRRPPGWGAGVAKPAAPDRPAETEPDPPPPGQEEEEEDEEAASRYYVPSYEEVMNTNYSEARGEEQNPRLSISLPSYESLTGLDETTPTSTRADVEASPGNPPDRQNSKLAKRLKPLKVRRIKSEKLHLKDFRINLPDKNVPPPSIEPLTPPPQYDEVQEKTPDTRPPD